ncbi:HupE/UreJ family protein [Gammaproteobacteria bacterium]|nr:HupE/UreJ family protein [Gammaproteobacteria bacterium]
MNKLFVYFLIFFFIDLESHEFNPAHLVIDQLSIEQNTYSATWMYPLKNIGKRAELIFPDHCLTEAQSPYPQGKYLVEKISLNCSLALQGHVIEVINLSVLTDALITINFINEDVFEGLMNLKESKILIPLEVAYYPTTYFTLGIDHLFSGIDHILFILGLLFLVSGLFNILKTITAFTIAHSITLGLSVFGIISLPQATVEVLIALTIIYLALELSASEKYEKTPWIMAFGFGLLHGLGFASALTEIGIANDQMLLSLLFFNLGIEAGQVSLIPIFGLFIWFAHKFNLYDKSITITSYALGGMGFYWLISRFIGLIS